jgi:hypothetical protein
MNGDQGQGGAVATLDYNYFITLFPEFTNTISEPMYEIYWDIAGKYCRNDGTGLVSDQDTQFIILNLLCAHLGQLFAGSSLMPALPFPGAVSSATEGSVSMGITALIGRNPNAAWYQQTKYGAAAWDLMAPYRLFRYFPGPRRVFDPFYSRRW